MFSLRGKWINRSVILIGLALLVPTGKAQAQLPFVEIQQTGSVLAIDWSLDGSIIASATEQGTILLSAFPSGKEIARLETNTPINALRLSPNGKLAGVKVAVENGPLCIWEFESKKQLRKLAFQGYAADQIAFTEDGNTLVAAGPGQHIEWHHSKGSGSGSRIRQMAIGCYAAAQNGQVLGWTNPNGTLQYRQTHDRKYLFLPIGQPKAIAFSPDGKLVASAEDDKTVRLWELASGKEIKKYEGMRETAVRLTFSGNGQMLAASFAHDPVVRLFDVGTGRFPRRLNAANPATVQAVALSPDGRSLAQASGNKVLIWHVTTRNFGDLGPAVALPQPELEGAWTDLVSAEHGKADAAFQKLARSGNHATGFLKEKVRAVAVPPIDWEQVNKLMRELNSSTFAVREKASSELDRYGDVIRLPLEKYIAGKPGPEGRSRAERLLAKAKDRPLAQNWLRAWEAIEILEIVRTPEARTILEELARDALIAPIRVAAQESLQRVNRPAEKKSDSEKVK